ncbi:MAG: magnesium transporter [Firmicutes bacterium]|nr:magnesium transporter [Bacillota bacterium]
MADVQTSLYQVIQSLLESKKYSTLRDMLSTLNPVDIAAVFQDLPELSLPLLFRLLPKELAADAFVEMDEDAQELLIKGFSDRELKDVVNELYVDDAVDLVEEMPASVVKRILQQTSPDMRKMINEILKYPEDSAGSIMTIEYVSLRPKMTVDEALQRIRRTGVDKETIYTCYVTSEDRRLLGIVTAKSLLLTPGDARIEDIMEDNVISVNTFTDQEQVALMFNKYGFLALPVVDQEDRLVGIVTVDDAIDVMTEETTEDIEKMAAIVPSDKPYLKTGIFATYRQRIPWLLILMISATFTGLIIQSFESALAVVPALIAFIPMLMDSGGNSGSQASVTVIRGLSLNEIEFSDLPRVLWKEFRVAILCSATLVAANFVKLLLIDRVSLQVDLVVCLTLFCVIIIAKLVGCSLPMFAKKLKLDPAVMASPFITTIVDALALLTYFAIAATIIGL